MHLVLKLFAQTQVQGNMIASDIVKQYLGGYILMPIKVTARPSHKANTFKAKASQSKAKAIDLKDKAGIYWPQADAKAWHH